MFPSQHVRNVSSGAPLAVLEEVHGAVARNTFRSHNAKSTAALSTFGSWAVQKVYAAVARSTCRSQNGKRTPGSFVVFPSRGDGFCALLEVSQTCGFCSASKNDGRRGMLEEDLQRCILRGGGNTKRHLHQISYEVRTLISWDGLHFGASDRQVR